MWFAFCKIESKIYLKLLTKLSHYVHYKALQYLLTMLIKIFRLVVLIFVFYVAIALTPPLLVVKLHQKYDSKHREKSNHDEKTQFLRIKSSTGILLGWQFEDPSSGKFHCETWHQRSDTIEPGAMVTKSNSIVPLRNVRHSFPYYNPEEVW